MCALSLAVVSVPAQIDSSVPSTVSFPGMAAAIKTQDYTIVQLRRFLSDPANVITVREEVRVDANGSAYPDYEIDYLGVVGEPNGSSQWNEWAQTYNRHGSMFVEHGLFQVRDLPGVTQNYTLHDFGLTVRAGRNARRVVVFPGVLDKAIWLLEVDVVTLVPLYTAEYDNKLRLMSEIEAVSLSVGAPLIASATSSPLVATLPSYAAAKAYMGNPAGMVDPLGMTCEYDLNTVKVKTDPLNNRTTMILEYTDGVDQFFVTQTPGAADFLAGFPVRRQASTSHAIARYRDPAMRVLLFWDDGVAFQVAGRGSMLRLDEVAKTIYTTAIFSQ